MFKMYSAADGKKTEHKNKISWITSYCFFIVSKIISSCHVVAHCEKKNEHFGRTVLSFHVHKLSFRLKLTMFYDIAIHIFFNISYSF